MREIKFRAWDIESKQMDYEIICGNYNQGSITDLNMFFKNKSGESDIVYIFMQFTGLIDKNGKEIYEGDIVHQGKVNVVVQYQAPEFITRQKLKSGWSKNWSTFILNPAQPQFEEVIGNIYENPELIT